MMLLDTSAWIEYLEGSKLGEFVNKILSEENEIIILSLIISEVISKVKRKELNYEVAYESMIKNAKVFDISPKISREAGILHANFKKKLDSFSLADALSFSSAFSKRFCGGMSLGEFMFCIINIL